MNDSSARTPATSAAQPDADHHLEHREAARHFDRWLHAQLARTGAGLSPVSLALAAVDWSMHMMLHPAETGWLALHGQRLALQGLADPQGKARNNDDPRFAHSAWEHWPWSVARAAHGLAHDWWTEATALRGMSSHHREVASFFARQWLDALAPANFGATNPEVLQTTWQRAGRNLVEGAALAQAARQQRLGSAPTHTSPQAFEPGRDVAVTPGKVVHRNELIELIQYLPMTSKVQAEPIFIVPSWIMKYYILDLSPHNSMVRWLVEQGHTVFILSWRNPDASDAQRDMADYLELGIFDPLAAIARLIPDQSVHACGYCLGGTLLSLAAAALSRPQRTERADLMAPLRSVTLLAAETDFSEPGEMGVLIDEAQVTLLEDMMAERGYLTGHQMAGSFAYLHARDLVWSRRLREFWLGEPSAPSDLMAWNADVTRMPAAMHSEYLRRCYLRNEIAEGRFPVEGTPVSLTDIRLPLFVVGTERDHVSPWKSVYKIHRLVDSELTFVLTNGGHNAGIISEPGHSHRHYAHRVRPAGGAWVAPEHWANGAQREEGSWWQAWQAWLVEQGSHKTVKARSPTAHQVLDDAPGRNVFQRYDDRPL